MVWFKACPRCQRGDLILERDAYGAYLQCLQCGHTRDLRHPAEATVVLLEREPRQLRQQPA